MSIPEIASANGTNLRIIVFIDDLDRCQESVILQVLSAINLVLVVCEISVVLGIDKGMIERAIIKKYGDMKMNRSLKDNQDLADKYLQKIIQLPLDLPDLSEEQSKEFLEGQLGVFRESSGSAKAFLKGQLVSGSAKELLEGQLDLFKESRLESHTETGQSEKLTSSNIKGGETGLEIVSEVSKDMDHTTITTRHSHTSKILQFVNQLLWKICPSSLNTFCGGESETEPVPHDAQQVGDVPIPKDATNKISNKDYWSWIPLRELLFVRYSKGEQDAFCYFQKLSTNSRKFPREWKRFLNYHRLVWYIFYLTGEAKDLAGWQVQFISWIFVCWEWQENINFIIQNWNEVGVLSTESNKPSLYMIVDHFIELEDKKHRKGIEIGIEKGETKKAILGHRDLNYINNVVGSSKTKQDILETKAPEIMLGVNAGPLEKTLKDVLDKLKKEIKEELKKEMKEIKEELKKEMKDLKDQVMKQNNMKNEKREEEKKMKVKQWKKMRSALYKYDVTMEGILAFQRFRFYCIAGHLSWPLLDQENN
ncbi:hypothetical protein SUGI_0708060 [Cryptomeria japonica]|nr:hypothetical protein SUGI_0708060 [Cryptomeria japonica]